MPSVKFRHPDQNSHANLQNDRYGTQMSLLGVDDVMPRPTTVRPRAGTVAQRGDVWLTYAQNNGNTWPPPMYCAWSPGRSGLDAAASYSA